MMLDVALSRPQIIMNRLRQPHDETRFDIPFEYKCVAAAHGVGDSCAEYRPPLTEITLLCADDQGSGGVFSNNRRFAVTGGDIV